MIQPWLRYAILAYLWAALAEDTMLFVLAWIAPDLWFRLLHASTPVGLEIALLRRSAGQWAAFALAQAIALIWWRRKPVWLAVVAGVRFSDLFTDLSYILATSDTDRPGLDGVAAATPAQPDRCGDHVDGIPTGERLCHLFQIRPVATQSLRIE